MHSLWHVDRTPAPTKGPQVNIRFRSKAEIERIRRAARQEGMTFNTMVAAGAAEMADQLLKAVTGKSQASDTDLQPTVS
jgi:hypothetical protein